MKETKDPHYPQTSSKPLSSVAQREVMRRIGPVRWVILDGSETDATTKPGMSDGAQASLEDLFGPTRD